MSKHIKLNEKQYLQQYKPQSYAGPIVSVDSTIFTIHEDELKVLLIKRKHHPQKKKWSLVGGFIDMDSDVTLDAWAKRVVKDKTTVEPPVLEQFVTVGGKKRDRRGWSVSVCYYALMAYEACQIVEEYIEDVEWITVNDALDMKLAFDHSDILNQGLHRLRQKALYSIIPGYMLPEKFKVRDLQKVHEIILDKSFPRASFYRRLEASGLLIETGEKSTGRGRAADLYRLKPEAVDYFFNRNLDY